MGFIKEMYSIPEVAKILKMDQSSIKRWIKVGKINAIQLPSKHWRITTDSLEKILGKASTSND